MVREKRGLDTEQEGPAASCPEGAQQAASLPTRGFGRAKHRSWRCPKGALIAICDISAQPIRSHLPFANRIRHGLPLHVRR